MLVSVAPLLKLPIGDWTTYEVAESPVDPHGENAALLDAGFTSVDATIRGTHTDPGVLFEGTASGMTAAQCSRCLIAIESPVIAEFAEQYYATMDVATGAGLVAGPVDSKTIGSDFRVDLTPLLVEELIIATPFAPLCRPDCRGLCLACGEDLNDRPHQHDAGGDPRWARLQDLEGFRAERE